MALMAMAQGESASQPSPTAREGATTSSAKMNKTLNRKAIQKRRGRNTYLSDEDMKRLRAKTEKFQSDKPNSFPPIGEFLAWIFDARVEELKKIPSEAWIRKTYKAAGFREIPTRTAINRSLDACNRDRERRGVNSE